MVNNNALLIIIGIYIVKIRAIYQQDIEISRAILQGLSNDMNRVITNDSIYILYTNSGYRIS